MAEQSLKQRIQNALTGFKPHEAFELVREVEALIAQTDPGNLRLAENLENVRAQLIMVAMRYYKEKDLERVFENRVAGILNLPEDVDLVELFKNRLASESLLDDKNSLKKTIKGAIERSVQRLGSSDISLGTEIVKPTVQNWVKVYTSEVGSNRAGAVEIARFFSKNPDVQKLSSLDASRLRRLLRFYEYLKIDADEIEGYDQVYLLDDPNIGLVALDDTGATPIFTETVLRELENQARNGELSAVDLSQLQVQFPERFDRYKPKRLPGDEFTDDTLQQLTETYFQTMKERYTNSSTIKAKSKHSPLLSSLAVTQMNPAIEHIIELLSKHLSDRSSLSTLLNNPEVKIAVLKRLGAKDQQLINQQPFHPVALQEFLRALFEGELGLTEEESLWRSYLLLSRLPLTLKDFKTIVSYDVAQNQLVWRHQT